MMWFRKTKPAWISDYLYHSKRVKKKPVLEQKFAVLDIETTGFNRHEDRILSIAVSIIQGGKCHITDSKDWIIYKARTPVNEAAKIHGILPSTSQQGEMEETVIRELMEFIKDCIVVGHHILFDATMLDAAIKRHYAFSFSNLLIDTAHLSMGELDAFKKSGYSNQKPPSLDEVCNHLDIPLVDRHTAAGDVFTTSLLFLLLYARTKQKYGDRFSLKPFKPIKF